MGYNKNYLLHNEFPKAIKNATSTSDGLMSAEDKARIDSVFEFGILTPATHEKDGLMSKEDKIKMDGIEEGANNYIHPNDSNTRHVSDEQITKWDNGARYTNQTPMPISLGGLEKGTTFDDVDMTTILTNLFYPYVDPTISSINITPNTTINERGTSFILTRIRFNINTPSLTNENNVSYDFKNNGTSFHTVETKNRSIDETVYSRIDSNSSITVLVTDKINNKSKSFSLISYKFVSPFYYGTMTNEELTESFIESKTKMIQDKGTKTIKFNTNEEKMLFAYPKEYGKLRIIYDANNFNILDTFKIQEISIKGPDEVPIHYYVYINEPSTVSNYNVQFLF